VALVGREVKGTKSADAYGAVAYMPLALVMRAEPLSRLAGKPVRCYR